MLLVKGASLGSAQEETLISAGGDGAIHAWDLSEGEQCGLSRIGSLKTGHDDVESVLALALGLADNLLFSGRCGGNVDVWDLETKQLVRVIRPFRSDILSLALGGTSLFVTAANGEVKVCSADHHALT